MGRERVEKQLFTSGLTADEPREADGRLVSSNVIQRCCLGPAESCLERKV
ncbi:hypothetical protein [Paenibacillus donghaensis]|nr:hypothetical protein [Paenibacillus donghaensis]